MKKGKLTSGPVRPAGLGRGGRGPRGLCYASRERGRKKLGWLGLLAHEVFI
jgi:hypothetical protein